MGDGYATTISRRYLGTGRDECDTEHVNIFEFWFPYYGNPFMSQHFFGVDHCEMDGDSETRLFNDFPSAFAFFSSQLKRTFHYSGDPTPHRVYTTVDLERDFLEYLDEMEYGDEPYVPSASNGDYSPSCPWNAPGMSVSDFIPGFVGI